MRVSGLPARARGGTPRAVARWSPDWAALVRQFGIRHTTIQFEHDNYGQDPVVYTGRTVAGS